MTSPLPAAELHRTLAKGSTLDLLLRLQRGKPRTAEQIREIAPAGIDLGGALTALERVGLVTVAREGLRVEHPAPIIAGAVSAEIEHSRQRISDLGELLASLRENERPHAAEATPPTGTALLHFSAGDARMLWARIFDGAPIGGRIALPGLAHAGELMREWLTADAPHAQLAGASILIEARQFARPDARELIASLHDSGARIRLAGNLPYWLAVAPGNRAMLSADTGQLPLTGLISTSTLPIVDALGTVFDGWWADAVRYPLTGSLAERGLALRARGLNDDDAAAVLDVSARTLQREFASFMDAAGVRSRFELGVWWARNRQQFDHEPSPDDLKRREAR